MICPKCKREIHPWPLKRGRRCSPPDWVHCIRNDLQAVYVDGYGVGGATR